MTPPRALLCLGLVALATEPLAAQEILRPFRLDEDDRRPVMRAQPVRPPRPLPEEAMEEEVPVATPIPVRRAKPVKSAKATPAPETPKPNAVPAAPEPGEPGEIRIAPQTGVIPPEAIQMQLADSYYSKKMYDLAAPEYQRYLDLYPGTPDAQGAYFRLAECYRLKGAVNAAKSNYEALLARFQTGEFVGATAYRLGLLHYDEKNFQGAVPLFRRAIVRLKEPSVVNAAKFFSARCEESLGRKQDARLVYKDLSEMKENNPFRELSHLSYALLLKEGEGKAEASRQTKGEAVKQMEALAKEATDAEIKVEATVRTGLWLLELEPPQAAKAAEFLEKAMALPGAGRWKEVAHAGTVRILFEGGKYKEVLETWAAGSAQFSPETKPQILLLVAAAHRQLGQQTEALAIYDQLQADFPNSTPAQDAAYERLAILYNSASPQLAEQIDAWVANHPESPKRDQVLLMKAETLYKKNDFAGAAPIYGTLAKSRQLTGTLRAEALLRLGWCAMQTRDLPRAVAAFTELLETYPTHQQAPFALIQRAIAQQSQKNLAAAEKDFSEIIKKYPKAKERELALQQKARIRGNQNDQAGLAENFELLLADYPGSTAAAEAHYWVGNAAYETKGYAKAIKHLSESRQLDKEQYFEKTSLKLMLAHYHLEDREAVAREVDLYAKVGKSQPPTEIVRWLAEDLFKGTSYQSAEKYFQLLTSRDEAVPDDFLFLARSRLQQDKFADAETPLRGYLDRVRDAVPRAAGLLELARALLGQRKFADAQKAVDEALTLQPEGRWSGEARISAGDIQMAQAAFEVAANTYASVGPLLDDEEVTPRALDKAVEAYRKAGKEEQAKKTLNILQSRYPEYLQRKNGAAR